MHTSLIDLDVDLACWLNFIIDVEATGHLDVAPWRRFGNATSQIYKALVDASLRAFSHRDAGDYDYGLSAQVRGHVAGQFKVKLTLVSTEQDAFPRAIHVAPEDVANLQLSLDDYSVNWLWIKRLQLIPIGLLERVVNLQVLAIVCIKHQCMSSKSSFPDLAWITCMHVIDFFECAWNGGAQGYNGRRWAQT